MTSQESELLAEGLAAIGYDPAEETIARFDAYIRELLLWNKKLGLVRAAGSEFVTRHLLDCAAAIRRIMSSESPPRRVADAGAGAGLPGLPFAILHPEVHVDLVERSGRRIGFLRNARIAAGVDNADVHQCELHEFRGETDAIVYRAFLPFTDEVLRTFAHVVPTGRVFALKGKRAAIDEELSLVDLATNGYGVVIDEIDVPFLAEERHLVTLQPLRDTA